MARQTITITVDPNVKAEAQKAGLNISGLTQKAIVEELELFSGRVPYSQASYEIAKNICKDFKLDGHRALVRAIACSIEDQYQRYVEDYEEN